MERRKFIQKSGMGILGMAALGLNGCSDLMSEEAALQLGTAPLPAQMPFKISLAQWSLNNSLWAGKLDNLDFAQYTKETFQIDAVEYVNQFFIDKAKDTAYLSQMKQRAADHGVKNLLIMIDMEGNLASLDESARLQAVDNHYKWIDAAKFLDCHTIRVNAIGKGERNAVANAMVDSLGKLSEYGAKEEINVVVENHGGYSSDAAWLSGVIEQVNNPFCGTLPDFGNFLMNLFPRQEYDPLKGLKELMPYAKGVSAKSHDFNSAGENSHADFEAMIKIVQDFGYKGYIGIEYEGYKLSEEAGIKATKDLLIRSAINT
ncbi:MAG: sugar phosphate isomerase/epimerase family protein [Bacteroidota bacterium]